jgi:sarcosine oxidase, subunit beta
MERFDVVVIGGGAAGTACVYHLARHGLHTLLVEREHLAAGSSGRSAAFVETQYTDPDRVRLTVYAERLLERLSADHDVGFVQHGKLWLAREDDDLKAYASSVDFQRSLGVTDSRILSREEVGALAPALRIDDLAGALYGPRDGYVDPPRLCALLVELSGAEVRRARVTGVDRGRVETDRGDEIACDAVVNTAGAWACEVGALAGLEVPVAGHRREVVVLEGGDGELPLVVEPLGDGDGLYLRGDGGELVLAGVHSHTLDEPADPDSYREAVDSEAEREVVRLVRRRYRGGDSLRLRGGWAGLYPLTPDGLPIVGEAEAVPGFWNLVGLGGNGIQLSPGFGAVVADLLATGSTDLLPEVERYRLERFTRSVSASRPS